MKPGRNNPCPCGSGKKYKHCCIDSNVKKQIDIVDDLEQILAMNPDLTLDELNVVLDSRMSDFNNRPNPDFFGLTPTQMANWLYAPFHDLAWVTVKTPIDLSGSPVMRYLTLILDEALQGDGSFKATSKGNLPVSLVKRASDLFPEFAVAKFPVSICINEYAGANEDKFNALHYARILADIAGIIYRRAGRYHVKKTALKTYHRQGIHAFFKPMLEAAVTGYNWAYLDRWGYDVDLRTFWLFMLWRLQSHASVDQLTDDMLTAFPDVLSAFPPDDYVLPEALLESMIESRFIDRFLGFWGFAIIDPKRFHDGTKIGRKVEIQPLLRDTFEFSIEGATR